MGTGLGPGSYAIVSQGQIDAILSSKPTERRALFEETAGIGKFLARKAEALRRLDATEQNAIRVNDLIAELERRVPELDTQVRRARRYRRVTARVRDLEILSYLRASASRREERERGRRRGRRTTRATQVARRGARGDARRRSRDAARATLHARARARRAPRRGAARARGDARASKPSLAAATARRDALDAQSHAQRRRPRARRSRTRDVCARASPSSTRALAPLAARAEAFAGATKSPRPRRSPTRARRLDSDLRRAAPVEAIVAERAASEAERRARLASTQGEIARLDGEAVPARRRSRATRRSAPPKCGRRLAECDALVARFERELAAGDASHGRARKRRAAMPAAARVGELQAHYRASRASSRPRSRACTRSRSSRRRSKATFPGRARSSRRRARRADRAARRRLQPDRGRRALRARARRRVRRRASPTSSPRPARTRNAPSPTCANAKPAGRRFLPLDTLAARDGPHAGRAARPARASSATRTSWCAATREYRGIVAFLVGRVLVVDELRTGIALVRGEGFRDSIVTLEGEQIFGGGAITGGRFAPRALDPRPPRASAVAARAHPGRAGRARRRSNATALAAKAELDAAARGARRGAATPPAKPKPRCATRSARRDGGARPRSQRLDDEQARGRRTSGARGAARSRATRAATHAALEGTALDAADLEDRARRGSTRRSARRASASPRAEAAQHDVAARSRLRCARSVASLTTEREGLATRLDLLDADSERVVAARERDRARARTLRARHRRRRPSSLAAARERGGRGRRARSTHAGARREATANDLAQREADERIARNEDREATAAGEGSRRRLAEIDAELGMLVQTFAQNPATDDEQRDVAERYADEPDDVLRRAAAAARRAGAARAPTSTSTPKPTATSWSSASASCASRWTICNKRARRCSRRSPRSRSSCQVQFNETFDGGGAQLFRDVRAALPRRRSAHVADRSRAPLARAGSRSRCSRRARR